MNRETKVKICGICDPDIAVFCLEEGADFLGLNFSPTSVRKVSLDNAKNILGELEIASKSKKRKVSIVNLFYQNSNEEIEMICREIKSDLIQLIAKDEKVVFEKLNVPIPRIYSVGIEKKISDEDLQKYNSDFLILDTYKKGEGGGSGFAFDWDFIKDVRRNYLLAGGLTPENVFHAIKYLKPYGVDVASGVESAKGIKDKNKIREFIQNAKRS